MSGNLAEKYIGEMPETDEPEATVPAPGSEPVDNNALPQVVARIGGSIGELSVNVADMSGTVGDVSSDLTDQLMAFEEVVTSVEHISEQNSRIAALASEANAIAERVGGGLETTVSSIEGTFSKSVEDIQTMASSSERTHAEFGGVKAKLDEVYGFSQSITKISSETQFLAINAGIMAANTGEAGKGFAVIAESIRELALETSSVSKNIVQQLDRLKQTFDILVGNTEANNSIAVEAVNRTDEIETQIRQFREFSGEVSEMTRHIVEISEPIERNSATCLQVADRARSLNRESGQNAKALNETFHKFDELVSFCEEMILLVEQSGVETRDTPVIKLCMQAAGEIENLFESAVSSGRISMNALFDENYVPVTGSDPQQHMTAFTGFTDEILPPVQELARDAHSRVVFAACVDRNGYLPTHNNIYSHPQGDDPVWNAANCRNRRIFNDRTGAAAGRNTKPFLMQTYRRDMGGGQFALMKDLSVPIYVRGRHWGGLRMGVQV